MKQSLQPIAEPFPADVADILAKYPQGQDGCILQLFRVFANSKRFLTDKGPSNLLDKGSPLSLRQREIIILRVTANNQCEYEWGVHVSVFAKAARLTPAQIAATCAAEGTGPFWDEDENLLIQCIDQLCQQSKIQDAIYEKFQEHWTLEQQLEILALCGNYHLVSLVANTSRLSLEPASASFSN